MSASKPKAPRENRTKKLKVRLKPSELAEAKRLAQGRSLSGIIRAALLGLEEPKVRPGPKPPEPMTSYWLLDSNKVSAFWPHRLNLGLLRTPVEVAKTPLGKVEVLDLIDKLSRCKRGQRRPAASGS